MMAQQVGHVSPDGRWLWNGSQWIPNVPVAAPQSTGTWARPYESARARARLVRVFLAANIVGLVIGIVYNLVVIAIGHKNWTDTQAVIVVLVALAFLVTYLGTSVPAIVFFCMWLHRVVRNMPALGALDPRWSPAGAVGRCFIPFLNLIHPMSGTLEAWRGSESSRRWINVGERKAMRVPGLVSGWWALWLIGWFLSTISIRMSNSSDATTAATGDWIEVFSSVVTIGAAILAGIVVREVTDRQDRKNDLIVSGQLA
jgi:hypothetical protein